MAALDRESMPPVAPGSVGWCLRERHSALIEIPILPLVHHPPNQPACACGIERLDQERVSRAPHGIPLAAPSAIARLRSSPRPRTLKSGRSAVESLLVVPFRRSSCQRAERSCATRSVERRAGTDVRCQRRTLRCHSREFSCCRMGTMHATALDLGGVHLQRQASLVRALLAARALFA